MAINPPQIPFSGNVGSGGKYPLFNSASIDLSSDADYTLTHPGFTASVLCFTSSVSLTATRRIIAPTAPISSPSGFGFEYAVQNLTTGGQDLLFIGATGNGVVIPNRQAVLVFFNGTDYVSGAGLQGVPGPQGPPGPPGEGGGGPPTVNQLALLGNTAAIGGTNALLFDTSAGGFYRLSFYYVVTRIGSAGGVQLKFAWDDSWRPQTETMQPLENELGMFLEDQIVIRVPAGQNINYTTDYHSTPAATFRYDLYISVEKLFT